MEKFCPVTMMMKIQQRWKSHFQLFLRTKIQKEKHTTSIPHRGTNADHHIGKVQQTEKGVEGAAVWEAVKLKDYTLWEWEARIKKGTYK